MSHTHLHVCWYWLHAGRDENVLANLRQYGLEAHYVDMVVADAARCVWKPQEIFDAIVTDRELASFLTVLLTDSEVFDISIAIRTIVQQLSLYQVPNV